MEKRTKEKKKHSRFCIKLDKLDHVDPDFPAVTIWRHMSRPNLQPSQKWLFDISSLWCQYHYFTAPDRVRASPAWNRKYQTCLIFTIAHTRKRHRLDVAYFLQYTPFTVAYSPRISPIVLSPFLCLVQNRRTAGWWIIPHFPFSTLCGMTTCYYKQAGVWSRVRDQSCAFWRIILFKILSLVCGPYVCFIFCSNLINI